MEDVRDTVGSSQSSRLFSNLEEVPVGLHFDENEIDVRLVI